ncbi:MAG TPA: DUF3501 family protein [Thermoanaerobaculia bacterium]|nr:DUF3501 family protein [Thermoanaerobaculia bacterium]
MNRRTNRIDRSTILDLGDYERQRETLRPRAIAARSVRRVALGPNATVAFENRETVAYQIQEMLRAERIAKEAEVQHEIDTYSDLLPSPDELSATVMFEFTSPDTRALRLHELVGFEEHLKLDVEGAGVAQAYFDRRQLDADRISAVQFVRFPLNDAQRHALAAGVRVTLLADHPRYVHAAALKPETARALATDLQEA